MELTILYRGPLSSCNYDCGYCPFAKRHEIAAELRRDREALERFVTWVADQSALNLSLLFTPWGEALVRPWYQSAIVRLSHLPNLRKVAIQTNLSCEPEALADCERTTTALWCTYHPGEVTLATFLDRCARLTTLGIQFSVGMVGLRESFDEMERMRKELPSEVYLWINAYKDQPKYYADDEIERLTRVDPLFRFNLPRYDSLGRACRAGSSAISVDGAGDIRRCHFVSEVIGNIYEPDWQAALRPRSCPQASCGCYIGYIHLPHVRQRDVFGGGLLERIPQIAWRDSTLPEQILAQLGDEFGGRIHLR